MLTTSEIEALVGRDDPVIFDIGANDGEHTQMFLDVFPRARVYSFEPDPRACDRFRARVTDPRATLVVTAVGAMNGYVPFYQSHGWPNAAERERLPEGWDLSGSIRKPTGHLELHPWCAFQQTLSVPITKLDTWVAKQHISDVDFIWADVQGAESDLIIGGEKTLAKARYFYVEYSNRELYEGQVTLSDLRRMLPVYTVARLYSDDVLFKRML